MARDISYYEEIQGLLRGLLISLEDHFSRDQAAFISEEIDANELGIALEMMSEILSDANGVIPNEHVVEISRLGEEMGLSGVVEIAGRMMQR